MNAIQTLFPARPWIDWVEHPDPDALEERLADAGVPVPEPDMNWLSAAVGTPLVELTC